MYNSINKLTLNKTKTSINTYNSFNAPHSTNNQTVVLKADSGATNHYFKLDNMTVLTKVQKISHKKNAKLPNSTSISVTHEG